MTTLLVAEHDNGHLADATAKALTAALELGAPVHVLVAGAGVAGRRRGRRQAGGRRQGAAGGRCPPTATCWPSRSPPLVVSLAPGYDAIVAPATTTGKNVMPRVAALLDVMQISDIIKVVSPDTFERPIYAGNAIQTVQSTDQARSSPCAPPPSRPPARAARRPIEAVAAPADPGLSSFDGEELSKSDRPELTAAKIVVSGGRGHAVGRELQEVHRAGGRQAGRRGGRLARRGRCRLSCPTTSRSARPARSWRRSSTSRSASPAPSSIWPA